MIIILSFISTHVTASDLLKTEDQKSSYVIGVEVAKQFQSAKEHIDIDSMVLGIKDQFAKNRLKLSEEEMRNGMMYYQDKEREIESQMLLEMNRKNSLIGDKFRLQNEKEVGVTTTKSGLQYRVIKSGNGNISPKRADTVVAHYQGTLIDGTVFDSSTKRNKPIVFPLNRVIKGWTEALLKMKAGDKWQLVVPPTLAYGEDGVPPRIPPGSTLIFDIELLEIK